MKYLIICILLIGCSKYENDYKVYSIKSHRSGVHTTKQSNNCIQGNAYFTESCEYVLTDNIGQINKLIGLCSGMNGVHQNSIRVGWEYEDSFKLYSYYYIDGVREHEYITSVQTKEVFSFEVRIDKDSYYLRINQQSTTIKHNIDNINSWVLFPYFGGEEPNPDKDKMNVMIDII